MEERDDPLLLDSDEILKRFNNTGFTIMMKETKRFTKELLIQFYSRHQGLPWFDDFIQFMTSDVSEVIVLAREDAGLSPTWRKRRFKPRFFSDLRSSNIARYDGPGGSRSSENRRTGLVSKPRSTNRID